ncbi:MAG: hypothetical protein LC808_03235 [Actinobacteria bacterium]|nr:hypothetical protein [Actinomycetota bacterium]
MAEVVFAEQVLRSLSRMLLAQTVNRRPGTERGQVWLANSIKGFTFQHGTVKEHDLRLEFSADGLKGKTVDMRINLDKLEPSWHRNKGTQAVVVSAEEDFARSLHVLIQEVLESGARRHLLSSPSAVLKITLGE